MALFAQIVASPWVEPGTVVHSPASAAYCHSSIPATLRKIFAPDAAPLTNRTAWAATFDSVLTRTTPNTHAPMRMPNPPPLRSMFPTLPPLDGKMPMSHLQEGLVRLLAGDVGDSISESALSAMNEGEGAAYVRDAMCRLAGREVVPRVPESDSVLAAALRR